MGKTNSAIAGAAAGASVGGPWGAAVGGVAGFLGGSDDKSSDFTEQMLREAQNIPLPILKDMNPELYKAVINLTPEMESNIVLGPSATDGIALDPRYKQAQMTALSKMMDVTNNGGQDAQFKADASKVQNEVNSNLQGNTAAIQQNMATRGLSGGMSEMVNKQLAAQQASNKQAQMGMDINAQAQQRALSAMMNQSNMANQMSNTDFNQQNTKAQSNDAISKFNAQNLQNVNATNTQARNSASQMNAANQQTVANKNVDLSNTTQQFNNGLAQQQYDNELKKKGLVNNALQSNANNSYNQSKDQDAFIGGVASSVAKYGAAKK